MRIQTCLGTAILTLALAGCERPQETQHEREQKTDEQMRQAGRAAYDAAQKAENAAKELSRQVESAGKAATDGWNDAKREHEQQPKKQ